jgi:hypothetical protein
MLRGIALLIVVLWFGNLIVAQDLSYYLPDDANYNPDIPTPASVIGHEVGEWHVSHDRLVWYLKTLAAASDRITIETYAHTYEQRPLLLMIITSAENHRNLEQIQTDHLKISNPEQSGTLDLSEMPAIVWMGYSVHGNEASGSNASLLAAYHLAAAEGPEIENLLNRTVILIDPSINPDGMNRFASWVNSRRSKRPDGNVHNLEHDEPWPGGRTNHYWFDLNRDWLPLQHPESQGRLVKYHQWKPNVVTDHHEMSAHRTFFFQPGIPSRNNPLTPEGTHALTKEIAKYHASALDKIGSLYYSEESYDDFYYGKGSTYPDVNGGVGILFEQASARGHLRNTASGTLSFPFAIRNQFTTTLSTLEASLQLRTKLLEHQKNFFKTAVGEASKDDLKAFIFQSQDKARLYHFLDILERHQVSVYQSTESISVDNQSYNPERSFIVPLEQPQYRLIKSLFEQRTSFQDSLFYDVSTWTLPLAFDFEFSPISAKDFRSLELGEPVAEVSFPVGEVKGELSQYGYVFDCSQYYTYSMLHQLFEHKLKLKVATEQMILPTGARLSPGAILVPVDRQPIDQDQIYQLMLRLAKQYGITIHALTTGSNTEGKDWGSPTVLPLTAPKILVITGSGVSGYEVGEVWHLLDQRLDIKMSLVSQDKFNGLNLEGYNTIVMVSGRYNGINKKNREKLKRWIENGGQVISWKQGVNWLSSAGIGNVRFKKEALDTLTRLPYGSREKYAGARKIGGAIFEVALDLTHPLNYGMPHQQMPVFKNSEWFFEMSKNPFTNPVVYTDDPLLSGYAHPVKLEKLKGSPAVEISHLGKGRVISFSDNPNFRAFWYGTNRFFLNALFFGGIIQSKSLK